MDLQALFDDATRLSEFLTEAIDKQAQLNQMQEQDIVTVEPLDDAAAAYSDAKDQLIGAHRHLADVRNANNITEMQRNIADIEATTLAEVEAEWAIRDETNKTEGKPRQANNEGLRKAEAVRRLAKDDDYQNLLAGKTKADTTISAAQLEVTIAETEWRYRRDVLDALNAKFRYLAR